MNLDSCRSEVERKERFAFGKNWANFFNRGGKMILTILVVIESSGFIKVRRLRCSVVQGQLNRTNYKALRSVTNAETAKRYKSR